MNMNIFSGQRESSSGNIDEEMRLNLEKLHQTLEKAGIRLALPYSADPTLNRLKSKSPTQQVLESLITNIEILNSAIDNEIDLTDNRGLFWVACRRFNLRPTQSFMDLIGPDDVLEIYSLDYKQMFCSINFWCMVSYTLDQVFLNEFWELYGRDSSVNDTIGVTIAQALKERKTLPFDSPSHIMAELASPGMYRFEMTLGHVSPLFDREDGQPAAFVSAVKARRLN